MVVGAQTRSAVLHVAEGEIDALAIARSYPDSVYGVGSCVGLVGRHREVVTHADGDCGGHRAATRGLASVRARGFRARVCWYPRALRLQSQRADHLRGGEDARDCPGPSVASRVSVHAGRGLGWRGVRVVALRGGRPFLTWALVHS